MMNNIWVERYRPHTVADCILPRSLQTFFNQQLQNKEVINMLLVGAPGTGKTTVAKALCEDLNLTYLFINASEEGNIDTLRTRIKQFASTSSIYGTKKVVILDEGDYLNSNSTQPALRAFIEEYSDNCRFIITANYSNRIIQPLHSRLHEIEFVIPNDEKEEIAKKYYKKLQLILDENKITYDKAVLAKLITRHFPDLRKTINVLQGYANGGTIDVGILSVLSDAKMTDLMKALKQKDFNQMRKWVGENAGNDSSIMYRQLYDAFDRYMLKESLPEAVLILAEYQYKDAMVADKEINLVAALTEIMSATTFK